MHDDLPDPSNKAPVIVRFLTHLFDLPRWQKLIVVLAGVLGAAGIGGKLGEKTSASPADSRVVSEHDATAKSPLSDGMSRGVLPQSPDSAKSSSDTPASQPTALNTFLATHSPWMRRVGLSFLACFILGWLFRAFVRLMTTIATVAMMLFLALSYFGVTNVDLTAVHQKYDDSITWVNDQAAKAKDALIAHIPSSTSSLLGFAFGFKRRHI